MRIESGRKLVILRRGSQIVFLFIFFYLFLSTTLPVQGIGKGVSIDTPVKLFFHIDPLIGIVEIISSHSVPAIFILSLIVIGVTILFNRIYCGWICPLGTIHQVFSSGKKASERTLRTGRWKWNKYRIIKYLVLFFVIGSALIGVNVLGWFDPLAFLYRSIAIVVHPLLGRFFDGMTTLLDFSGLYSVSDWLTKIARGTITPFAERFFVHSLLIGILLVIIIALNRFEHRFWCHYVCPLGALLGFLSRHTPLNIVKDDQKCTNCGLCIAHCQGGDQPIVGLPWIKTDCVLCGNCIENCPESALSFDFSLKLSKENVQPDISRRFVLWGIVSGFIFSGLQLIGAQHLESQRGVFKISEKLIRPPGAVDEKTFLSRCIKCAECIKVCPTNALQPSFLEGGLEGLWTPIVVPKIGYCDDRCTLCSQVCPTSAIEPITINDKLGRNGKEPVKIGLAHIDRNRCLPWAYETPCIVCEEVCPTVKGEKAIKLNTVMVKKLNGELVKVKQPHVDSMYCIGCGICENKCPVADRAAIQVTCAGETRSMFNRITLPRYQ